MEVLLLTESERAALTWNHCSTREFKSFSFLPLSPPSLRIFFSCNLMYFFLIPSITPLHIYPAEEIIPIKKDIAPCQPHPHLQALTTVVGRDPGEILKTLPHCFFLPTCICG